MAKALLAAILLWLLLLAPARPSELTAGLLLSFPLELPAIVAGLMLLQGASLSVARGTIAVILVAGLLLRIADLAAYAAFGRPFNPVLDADLVPAAIRLTAGTIGTIPTALLCILAGAFTASLLFAVFRATGWISALASAQSRSRAALASLFLLSLIPLALDLSGQPLPLGSARATRLAAADVNAALTSRADLARFRTEARQDPFSGLAGHAILPRLRGRDILIVFVESYGRSALDNPLHASTIRETLARSEAALSDLGLVARSGWLEAPTTGGQSWLSHGTLLSGLRIDSQPRYDALMASPRLTLARIAQQVGWRSVGVMPAITLDWPEAGYFGYDAVLAARDLGYAGQPFNWVTMPDQYTLAAFERLELNPDERPPVLAEIALISSHAPWTPIPPLIPWEAVGDGRVFDEWATVGESPDVLWRDHDKLRAQYRAAVDYALTTTFSFAARRAGTAPVFIVLGDHQPVGFVSGNRENRDIPIHLIGAPEVVDQVRDWNWTPGLLPSSEVETWPMEAFRDRFLTAFGEERHS